MKKLMVMAVVIGVAALTQAATFSWTSNNYSIYANGTAAGAQSDLSPYTLVLVNLGSTKDWDKAKVIPTDGTAYTTLVINSATSSKRGRVNGVVTFTYTGEASDLIHNGDYLALMVQDSDKNLSKLEYVSGGAKVEEAVLVSGFELNTDKKSGTILMTGNFTAAVPEPTSAMLLLIGVAGLALRRRRA